MLMLKDMAALDLILKAPIGKIKKVLVLQPRRITCWDSVASLIVNDILRLFLHAVERLWLLFGINLMIYLVVAG